MSGYIGTQPVPQATQTRDSFTATAGQTSFATGGYTPQFLDVYLNGIFLNNGSDYTAGNGSDVILTSGAAADDILEVVAYTTFESADHYTKAVSDSRYIAVGISTLNVAKISDGTDTVETGYVVNGSAKAWVNFNGTGTVAIRDSLNVASLTDIGTGLCTINLTNSMGNVGYSVTNSVDGSGVVSGAMTEINSYSAGNFRVRGMNTQSGYAATDFPTQACSAHGDLA